MDDNRWSGLATLIGVLIPYIVFAAVVMAGCAGIVWGLYKLLSK
jgi:hypothetical protein